MMKLEQALQEKDITSIQNILKAYLISDPSDSQNTIKSSLQQIEKKEIGVWEEHDGKELSSSPWTEDEFLDLQVDLRMNFSKERFNHLVNVGEKIYGSEKKLSTDISSKTTVTSEDNQSKKSQAIKWGIVAITIGILIILLIKMANSNN
ncbi:hypothetical protein DHX103_10985 [Planococcus sp. X10-3]|uniref:hypothetical protein n=1 Tax=Planococcus sp. X10-3 TaxID=3061240 RepID=UPI003BB0B441